MQNAHLHPIWLSQLSRTLRAGPPTPTQDISVQTWDGCSFLFLCHSPSHETGDHFIRLYPVEPGGAHTVVNWSFSIWQNNQGGLAHLLPPSFSAIGLPTPLCPGGSQPHCQVSVLELLPLKGKRKRYSWGGERVAGKVPRVLLGGGGLDSNPAH